MNASNVWHGIYAVSIQCVITFALFTAHRIGFVPDPLAWCAIAGAFAGVFFFLGREHDQQERKLGGPIISEWWEGFTGWGRDQLLDVGVPVIACSVIVILIGRFHA